MTILCFLQNLWVKDPAGWKDVFQRHPDRRVGIIRHLLLDYGCLTGRRIKACFGEDLLKHMVFEEASREIAGDARTVCPPDPEHIKACFKKYDPDIVVTFGKVATDAIIEHFPGFWAGQLVACPHPAARQKDTVVKLKAAAEQIRAARRAE